MYGANTDYNQLLIIKMNYELEVLKESNRPN